MWPGQHFDNKKVTPVSSLQYQIEICGAFLILRAGTTTPHPIPFQPYQLAILKHY